MGVEKRSVSFDLELVEAIRTSASGSRQSVSAWLAEAARNRLKLEALGTAVEAWAGEFGPLTDGEVAEAERLLDSAARREQSGAASVLRC